MINFLKSLIGSPRQFSSYSDCPEVFYRFNGRGENGPKKLDVALGYRGFNEGDVAEYRFSDESRWRSRSYFETLWSTMPISGFTKKRLQKECIVFDNSITEPVARRLLRDKQDLKPITSTQRKRLLEYGISVETASNRREANELLKKEEIVRRRASEKLASREKQLLDKPNIEECQREIQKSIESINLFAEGWSPIFPEQLDDLEAYRDLLFEALEYTQAFSLESLTSDLFFDPKNGGDYYLEYDATPSREHWNAFRKKIFLAYLKNEGEDFNHISILRASMPTIRATKV